MFETMKYTVSLFAIFFISDVHTQPSTAIPSTSANPTCSIVVQGKKTKQEFDKLFNEQATKMVKIQFSFQNVTQGPLAGLAETNLFLPLTLTKTKKLEVRRLLMLKEELVSFSYSTLRYGVEDFAVKIAEDPENCFAENNLNISHLESKLRELVLGNFDPTNTGVTPEGELVCNQYIKDNGQGVAEFYYKCCYRDEDGNTVCSDLTEDVGLFVFFRIVEIAAIVALLYSPLLVPEHWYREKYINLKFTHRLKDPVKVKILRTADGTQIKNSKNVIRFEDLLSNPHMDTFKNLVSELQEDQVYVFTISSLLFKMRADHLVTVKYVPIEIFRTVYKAIFKCKVRDQDPVKNCCYSNMCWPFRPCKRTVPWHKFLENLMSLLLLPLIAIPWILRLYFYYVYEDENRTLRNEAAKSHSLRPDYPGNLMAYLTPSHGIFLFCYAVFIFDIFLFLILQKKAMERSSYVIRRSFRDMRGINRTKAFVYCIKILLIPIRKCGIFFLLVGWIYLAVAVPLLVLIIALYSMPLVNVIGRFLFQFLESKFPEKCSGPIIKSYEDLYEKDYITPRPIFVDDHNGTQKKPRPMSERLAKWVITLLLIISLIAFTVLAFEFIIVFVEYLFYQLVGLVLNWGTWEPYILLALLLIFYAMDSFKSVTKRYQKFSENLIKYVSSKVKDVDIETLIKKHPKDQRNNAFQLVIDESDKSGTKKEFELFVQNSQLGWQMPRVVLFLDITDIKYVTKRFFFKVAVIPDAGCPGSLAANLSSALSRLVVNALFLLLVLLIVAVFGDKYEVSGLNKALLVVVGGFMPYAFKNYLKKLPPEYKLNTDSPHFQASFDEFLSDYKESAFVTDIETESTEECCDKTQIDLLIDTRDRTTGNYLLVSDIVKILP